MTQKILSIGFSLLLSLTAISPALASDFVCRHVHGYGSIIRVDNPLVTNETTVSYKTLPDGDCKRRRYLTQVRDGFCLMIVMGTTQNHHHAVTNIKNLVAILRSFSIMEEGYRKAIP